MNYDGPSDIGLLHSHDGPVIFSVITAMFTFLVMAGNWFRGA